METEFNKTDPWHYIPELPEKDGEYLVEYKKGTHNVRLFLNGTFAVNYESKASVSNIVAWMEIPLSKVKQNNGM